MNETVFLQLSTEIKERLATVEEVLRGVARAMAELKESTRLHSDAIVATQTALIRHAAECPVSHRVEALEVDAAERRVESAATEKTIDRLAPLMWGLVIAVVGLVLYHAQPMLALLGAKNHP